jgi:hypothetical protein
MQYMLKDYYENYCETVNDETGNNMNNLIKSIEEMAVARS